MQRNLHALWESWHELLSLCEQLGATIGEKNAPPCAKQSPYTYLGMEFCTRHDVLRRK
jgi:hypothetical protein